jgi:hypothetical protein
MSANGKMLSDPAASLRPGSQVTGPVSARRARVGPSHRQ